METTRRGFLGTAAGIAGSVALGTASSTGVLGAESTPARLITYHGLRPTDPGGRLGLRNPERGWRIETVIAEPARKTFGPAHHLAGRVAPLYQKSSFSLAHSYSEPEGQPYSIDHWLSTAIASEPLRQAGMPVADGWFEDGFGQPAARTQFEYLQDHLGYRLELQSARLPERVKVGAEFRVEIELVNRGFSTLHNPRPVILVLKDRTGKVTELPVAAADPRQWQPFRPGDAEYRPIVHKITWTGNLPATIQPGWHQLGLWLPDAAESLRRDLRYAIRAANRDVPWWTDVRGQYGINVLGVIEVVP